MALRTLLSLALGAALVAAGCSSAGCSSAGTPAAECSRGLDCASGVCSSSGKCEEAGGGGGAGGEGAGQGGEAGAGQGGEGGSSGQAGSGQAGSGQAGSGQAGAKTCAPNDDGVITREETPMGAGLHAIFRFAQNVPVQSAGKTDNGATVYDFTPMLAGDHQSLVETRSLDGTWYGSKFQGASYASKLSDSEDLLGVFEVNDSAVLLRGVVSQSDGLTRTELTYSPPVTLLAFPLKPGSSWSTQSTVSGMVSGVFSTYFELYQSKVDAQGTAKVPFGEFPVMRVNVLLTRTVGALITKKRTFLYSAECFGTVAKIVGNDNDTAAELTQAAELSRLAP